MACPLGGPFINLPSLARAFHDFLAENAVKLTRDEDEMLNGGGQGSPALERYREERAALARLDRILKEKREWCYYIYDMGDSWEHIVKLRRVVELDEKFVGRLVGGERNFPPEDCGGVYGYYRCLAALGKLPDGMKLEDTAEDLEDQRDWLGDWDPEAFDLEKAKKEFDRPKLRKKKQGGAGA